MGSSPHLSRSFRPSCKILCINVSLRMVIYHWNTYGQRKGEFMFMDILKFFCVYMLVALRIKDNKLKCFALNHLYSLCRFHATAFCSLANKSGARVDSALYWEWQDWLSRFMQLWKTRQTMYGQRKIEARSCNHCCSGKTISNTYCECGCVSVALVIQHAIRMRHIVICGLSCSTIFFHVISKRQDFRKKNWK